MMKSSAAAALAGLLALSGAAAQDTSAMETIDIREWEVPYENSRPRDPFAESATSVWFVGQRAGYLAHLNTETGEIYKVDLKEGSAPHNLIVGSDGIVWYAGNRTALIGRFDPQTKEIEEIPMPDEAARDPHTLIMDDEEEHIWFTLQGANMMGRLTIEDRKVDLVPSQTEGSRPYGIKIAPNGSIWVALLGTHKLANLDPETMALREIELPREEARPRRLEVTADGRVWYVDYADGYLGVYNPDTEEFDEWLMPQGADARPYGTASDSQGRIWAVATGVQPNMFMGFDPETEEWFSATPVPSGGGTLRHMHYHEPSGAVWFGADTNYIGRAIVEPQDE
ncbi:virginiamycin B lyase family protein [Hyphococcus sp.]|uniref:Vgb family protein n=1 Tax=Hyphococcus sp. TaxID=2038636 RepID=UPI003CCBEAE9